MVFFYHAEANDAEKIFAMAKTIWHGHFDKILSREQVLYMLATFHTAETIKADMARGYDYYIIRKNDAGTIVDCGYTAFKKKNGRFFISKIYLFAEFRGQGMFKQTLKDLIIPKAREAEAGDIYLSVNKRNAESIKAYERLGFRNVQSVTEDIGNGYVKDDYIMELNIKQKNEKQP